MPAPSLPRGAKVKLRGGQRRIRCGSTMSPLQWPPAEDLLPDLLPVYTELAATRRGSPFWIAVVAALLVATPADAVSRLGSTFRLSRAARASPRGFSRSPEC